MKKNAQQPEALISEENLNDIRQDLNNTNPDLAIRAQTDDAARSELARYIRKNYPSYIHGEAHITEYIVKEIVGIGFLEDILATDGVTDIGWNGSFLTVETNQAKVSLTKEDLGGVDTVNEGYIVRIVNRFLSAQDKELNSSSPIIDLLKDNLRLNIVDKSLSPSGTTFSIRVTRPSLALNQDNFTIFAPEFVLDLIHTIMLTGAVNTISGITGTGKTELQKLMISFTNPKDRIIMVEDVAETHLKELFPDKDIYSFLTTPEHPITELVRASLRNNPNWVHVAETRGGEAYEMLQGVLTGNFIVTTLHTINTYAVPKRFSNMITNVYANSSEKSLIEDVLDHFDFGFHIEKLDITDPFTGESKRIRYLSEIREFKNDSTRGTLIFKQDFANGHFYVSTEKLSEEFQARMAKKFLRFEMPEYTREERTDIASTTEGKILANIRKQLGDRGRTVESRIYRSDSEGSVDGENTKGAGGLYATNTNVRPEYGDKLSDDSLFVTPNSTENYSNPQNKTPEPKSLYQDIKGVVSKETNSRPVENTENPQQFVEGVKEQKPNSNEKRSLKDRILK